MTQNPIRKKMKRSRNQQLKVNSGCLVTPPSSNVYLTWVSFTLGCGLLVGCKAVYSSATVVADLPSASCRCGACLYYVCAFLCSIVSSLPPLALSLARSVARSLLCSSTLCLNNPSPKKGMFLIPFHLWHLSVHHPFCLFRYFVVIQVLDFASTSGG